MKRRGQSQGAKRWHNRSRKARRRRRARRPDLSVYLGPLMFGEFVVEAAKSAAEMHAVARAMAIPPEMLRGFADEARRMGGDDDG